MPRRRSTRHYDVAATITPETGFKLSLLQLLIGIGAVFIVAVGYAYLVWGVAEIKEAQIKGRAEINEVTRGQNEKREALGKQFIESNEKIALSISQLTTLTAVQQERQKATDEKLERVLTQIGTALQQSPARR